MKLIIEIPEVDYNYIKQQVADGITTPHKIWIANGTPIPDNATNGDVIKAIFPDSWQKVYDICAIAWWNAPYQKGGDVE